MSQAWKITIFSSCIAIILGLISWFWPQIYSKLWTKHPDTTIYIAGYDHAYWIDELKEEAPKRAKITIKPKKFPQGIDELDFKEIPVILKKWKYPDDVKLFYIVLLNNGENKDSDIMIDMSFSLNKTRIISIKATNNENNVAIVQGGNKNSSRVVFKINELLPNTRQSIEVITKGNEIEYVNARSGREGEDIKKIFVFDVVLTPDKEYNSSSPFDKK